MRVRQEQGVRKPLKGFTLIEVMMGASIITIVSAALIGAFIGQQSLNLTARNLTAATADATRIMEEIRKQNTEASCTAGIPSVKPPSNRTSWDEWLSSVGKSMALDNTTTFELAAVTCQDATTILCAPKTKVLCPNGTTMVTCPEVGKAAASCGPQGPSAAPVAPYCGNKAAVGNNPSPAQVGTGEWKQVGSVTAYNPIRVTVAVGWVQRGRVIGSSDFYYQEETTTPGGFKSPPITTAAHLAVQESGNDGIVTSQAMLSAEVTCR